MGSISRRKALSRVIGILSKRDKNILEILAMAQLLLNFLDLVGIALLGALGSLAVNGIQSKSPQGQIGKIIEFLNLDKFTIQGQVTIIGVIATAVLLTRTAMSVILSKLTFKYLSNRAALISTQLTNGYFSQDYSRIKLIDSQKFLYSSSTGINSIFTGVIGMLLSIFVDTSLLIIVLGGMLILNPVVAIATCLLFTASAFLLHHFSHSQAKELGLRHSELDLRVNSRILQTIGAFREIRLRDGIGAQLSEIERTRSNLAEVLAKTSFLPNVSKYVLETVVILAALAITAFEFAFSDATKAVSTLAIFLSAGARLGPAVMRIQQSILQFEVCVGLSSSSLELLDEINSHENLKYKTKHRAINFDNFSPSIQISKVSYSYPGSTVDALHDISLLIPSGQTVGIVGKSGSGKSTLINLLLGMFPPTAGEIRISGHTIEECVTAFPGAIGYVPQEVYIFPGTIKENLTLGLAPSSISDGKLRESLIIAQLNPTDVFPEKGLDFELQEFGSNVSGGQRQRIGFARALVTNPKLLVLDEATSSLDSGTESLITEELNKLPHGITKLIVAHRLATLEFVDRMIQIEDGKVVFDGTYLNWVSSKSREVDTFFD